jgi:Zn-dependent M28 family amino/carboxypeptidase
MSLSSESGTGFIPLVMTNLRSMIPVFLAFALGAGCDSHPGGTTTARSTPEPEESRYLADLKFIAQAPRVGGSEQHAAVQKLCAARLAKLGYQVEWQRYGNGTNIIGRIPGRAHPEELVIVSAHYDTVPRSNGADDNGSGVAGLLETARLLAGKKHARTLVVAFWDGEEIGLLGSRAFARRAKESKAEIAGVYVYEMIGYRREEPGSQKVPVGFELLFPEAFTKLQENQFRANFIALVCDPRARRLASDIVDSAEQAGQPAVLLDVHPDRFVPPDLMRSDHAGFWEEGFPAIMITDTAEFRNPNYHSLKGQDTIETVNSEFTLKVIAAVLASARRSLAAVEPSCDLQSPHESQVFAGNRADVEKAKLCGRTLIKGHTITGTVAGRFAR